MEIQVSQKKMIPEKVKFSNENEANVDTLTFSFEEKPNGNLYIVFSKDMKSVLYPLQNGKITIPRQITSNPGIWKCNLLASSEPITTPEFKYSGATWISDDMLFIVNKNDIQINDIEDESLPQPLQIIYDDLMSLKEELHNDLEVGAFDGVGIQSIELVSTEGLVKTYRITLTNASTFDFQVTDGTDGSTAYELAVKKGFTGTEAEWLDSLRYDHSEEFTQLYNDLTNKNEQMQQSLTDADTKITQIVNAGASAIDSVSTAETDALNAIDTAKQDSLTAVSTAKSDSVSSVNTAKDNAISAIEVKQTESTTAVDTAKDNATKAVSDAQTSAVGAVNTAKTVAVNDVNTAKETAVAEIQEEQESVNDAISATNNDLKKLATIQTASGEVVHVEDSAEWQIQGITSYGQSLQDGTPSPENPIEIVHKEVSAIKLYNKNVLHKDNHFSTAQTGGISAVTNSDGSLTLNGTATTNVQLNMLRNADGFLPIGTQVSIGLLADKNVTGVSFQMSTLAEVTIGSFISKPITSTNQYTVLKVANGTTVDNLTVYPMLVIGSYDSLTWEESKMETITLSQPITLRGIPVSSNGNVTINGQQYVADRLTIKDGAVGVERYVDKAIPKDSIQFVQTPDNLKRCIANEGLLSVYKSGGTGALSNAFTYGRWGVFSENYWTFDVNDKNFYITPADGLEDKTELESLVNNTWNEIKDTVEIYAQLLEPSFEPLPESDQEAIKAISMYNPTTNIFTGAYTDITYIADPNEVKKYFDKRLSNLESALISSTVRGGGSSY